MLEVLIVEAGEQYIDQSFCKIIILPDDGPIRPKHVGFSGSYYILVNIIQLYAFFVLNYHN